MCVMQQVLILLWLSSDRRGCDEGAGWKGARGIVGDPAEGGI